MRDTWLYPFLPFALLDDGRGWEWGRFEGRRWYRALGLPTLRRRGPSKLTSSCAIAIGVLLCGIVVVGPQALGVTGPTGSSSGPPPPPLWPFSEAAHKERRSGPMGFERCNGWRLNSLLLNANRRTNGSHTFMGCNKSG